MVWLPVEVSEGQFTEQLIAGKQRKHISKQQIKGARMCYLFTLEIK